jgi:thiamine-phosphate pyrophosphorylase
VLEAADVAALLLKWGPTDPAEIARGVEILCPIVQSRGVACLLDGLPDLALRAGADGAHLTGLGGLKSALAELKPALIVGAGGLSSRHEAMLAGEAGADYVMFGEPDAAGRRPEFAAVLDQVAWWAEIFEVPCAGFAASLEEAAALTRAGAEFIAAAELVFGHADGGAAGLKAAARKIGQVEQT